MTTDWVTQHLPSDLPPLFLRRMSDLLGDEYDDFLEELNKPPVLGLRVNRLKAEPERVLDLLELVEARPLSWCEEGFEISPQRDLSHHVLRAAGLFFLQEPSAMAAVSLLDPQPGERVLDFCSAPGGKATQIAAHMRSEGLLWANDIRLARARRLAENLERCGTSNAVVSVERSDRLSQQFAGFFDRVLVDVPCTGEACFRRDDEAMRSWSPATVRSSARRQLHILEDAAQLVRPGGVLLYATCTFSPEENEGVVGGFLQRQSDFHVEEVPQYEGFSPGRPEWVSGFSESIDRQLRQTVRLWPHRAPGEGYYIARLRREERESAPTFDPWRVPVPAGPDRQVYEVFCEETLHDCPDSDQVCIFGPCLYILPPGMPEATGLRFLRPGWLLGEVRRGRFIPGHSLASALEASAARRRLDLSLDSEEVVDYLEGNSLSAEGEEGWLLVTVEGFPLGWGRRSDSTIKNYLPKEHQVD